MNKQRNLSNAKRNKNDEFYTQLPDIENEMKHYKKHFEGKVIYMNCDDPTESNFWRFFYLNFEHLRLAKIISTHFHSSKSTYKLEYRGGGEFNHETHEFTNVTKIPLTGNGDFRCKESIELLEEADIVVTNPPFSLFREYVAQLVEYDKKFIILGNNNSITYKEIFPLIKDGKLWLGTVSNKTMEFRLPDHYTKWNRLDEDGNKYGKVPAISWFTNLDIDRRHEKSKLWKKYYDDPSYYPTYDNYDAINVDKVSEIPLDYDGVMGVPITYLAKHNPDEFVLIGMAHGYMGQELGVSADFDDEKVASYVSKNKAFRKGFVCYTDMDGKLIVPYMRILIQKNPGVKFK